MQKQKLKQILCCGENPTIENAIQGGDEGYGILCSKKNKFKKIETNYSKISK